MKKRSVKTLFGRFTIYFLGFYFISFFAFVMTFFYMFFQSDPASLHTRVEDLTTTDIEAHYTDHQFDEEDRLIAERSGGVLQMINDKGQVVQTTHPHYHAPTSYTFEQLLKHRQKYYVWDIEQDHHMLFIPYTEADEQMYRYAKTGERSDGVWETYNEEGRRLTTTDESTEPLRLEDIVSGSPYFSEEREIVSFMQQDDELIVVRLPNTYYLPVQFDPLSFLKWIVSFHLVLLFVAVLFSWWIGTRFARPLYHFLKWMERLSMRDYTLTYPKRLYKNEKLKRKYNLYASVDESLRDLTKKLQLAEEERAQHDQLREEWITGLSHDLKTPLSSMYGYAVMLNSDYHWSEEEVRQFAETIEKKASYMNALLDDLNYTYALQHRQVTLEERPVELLHYVQEYSEKHIQASRLNVQGEEVSVLLDTIAFERVLENVVSNGLKYSEGIVRLRVERRNNEAILSIWNEAEPLPEQLLQQMFERYYRGTNTSETTEGTGLGLAIAKQIVHQQHGTIVARNASGGIEIVITLPMEQ